MSEPTTDEQVTVSAQFLENVIAEVRRLSSQDNPTLMVSDVDVPDGDELGTWFYYWAFPDGSKHLRGEAEAPEWSPVAGHEPAAVYMYRGNSFKRVSDYAAFRFQHTDLDSRFQR